MEGFALTLDLQLLVNTLTLPNASIFPFICNCHVVAATEQFPALITSPSQQRWPWWLLPWWLASLYRWSGQNVGLVFLMGREERTEQIPSLWAAHMPRLPTAVVSVSYESGRFSVREAISEWQRRMRRITQLFRGWDSNIEGRQLSTK